MSSKHDAVKQCNLLDGEARIQCLKMVGLCSQGKTIVQTDAGEVNFVSPEKCFEKARDLAIAGFRVITGRAAGQTKPARPTAQKPKPSPSSSAKSSNIAIPRGVLKLKSVEQARREILNKNYPAWVIIGSRYCPSCQKMKKKMASAQRSGGSPKSRIAYVDCDSRQEMEIIEELGLYGRFSRMNGIPQLYYLGRGTGSDKPRMALYEKYPQNFEDMNLELVFSGRVSSRVKDKYYDRIFGVWFAILEAISEGRL